ncbi:MAG TPA: type II toxin-antitoxin system ParD family antitoxin [Pararhizobium sp.]|uniref:type II toxin-antitoxin system ParD family antitoxin n=1 Tax=Pararhizobium sp. TaxID=1977563 RepID=UPI002CA9A922|nr:type II toxin-antitoxin system ParD family antitoxin [Pararhizobium sp.]HTO30326.1 type II toxin-antitoxin system ParD family antitoxin [Pararhizobium sp.]
MRTLTVSLTPRQAAMMQSAVAKGSYASNSEVVRDALRSWEQREEVREIELARLRKAYDDGMASGEGREVSADMLLAELKTEARKRG